MQMQPLGTSPGQIDAQSVPKGKMSDLSNPFLLPLVLLIARFHDMEYLPDDLGSSAWLCPLPAPYRPP